MNNKLPELVMKYPFAYDEKLKACYYGHGNHGKRLELDAMGTVETEADAFGIMVLPNKDTLKHVLRTHSIKYIAESSQPLSDLYRQKENTFYPISADSINYRIANDSTLFVVETFRWYEKGYRYPVFETVRSWEQRPGNLENEFLNTSFFYPPQDHYYLGDDEANLALVDSETIENPVNPWEGVNYNFYPNPVTTIVNIELYLPRTAQVKVQLRTQAGFLLLNENKGKLPQGLNYLQTNLSSLSIGNYVLTILLDDYAISEIIMKR